MTEKEDVMTPEAEVLCLISEEEIKQEAGPYSFTLLTNIRIERKQIYQCLWTKDRR
mgnify:CR=1 FL=1